MSDTIHEEHTVRHTDVYTEEPKAGFFSNLLAIVGFIILIVIVIWGVVHLASLSNNWFSTLFKTSAPTVQITAPAQATAGTPVTISWKYSSSDKGTYAFLYQCVPGFTFQTTSATGAAISIPCGAAYTVAASGGPTSISITPSLSIATSSVKVPFSILFMPSSVSGKRASGSAAMTIVSGTMPGTISIEPTPTPTHTPTKPSPETPVSHVPTQHGTPHATGPADLSVRILAIGVIDPYTGEFVHRYPSSPDEMAAVEFDIANVGGSSTGTWYFTAQLPTISGYTYNSSAQMSLAPGDHIVNTLRFTQATPGIIQVIADPNHMVPETNEYNNMATQSMNIAY